MKILFIGDPHLKISKFDLSCKFLTWVNETVSKVKPDVVVNLGDTFDTHSIIRSEILSEFRHHVKSVAVSTPYFYILGNHDMFKPNNSKYHALETLKDIKNFIVVDKILNLDKHNISMIPYIHELKDFPLKTNNICIAHQTFVGADYGYYRPDVGVDADKVSAEIIISGHIHKRQSFGKVIYPGTPFAQDIDDVNQDKGLMLFDTADYSYEFIDSPFPRWKGIRFEIGQEFSISDMHNSIVAHTNTVDNWIIEIVGPKVEIVSYVDSPEVVELKQHRNLRFKPEYNDRSKNSKVRISASSMDEIVSKYVDMVYSGSLDKTFLKAKALEVLKK